MSDRPSSHTWPEIRRESEQPSARASGMSLGTRLVILSTVLLAVVIVAVFISLSLQLRQETKELLQGLLNRSEQQVQSIKEENLRQLVWASSQVSSNPSLRAALETYRLEYEPGEDLAPALLATISNELDKVWAGLDHDLLVVTDDLGHVLAANNRDGEWPAVGANLSTLPVFRHALDPSAEPGDGNFGVITQADKHFLVSSVPIAIQGYIVGSLVLGDRIDLDFLPNIRAFLGGEIMVVADGESIVSTLPETVGESTGARALAENGLAALQPDGTIELADEEFLVTVLSLGFDQNASPVRLFLLRSLSAALADSDRKLARTLTSQALVAIVLVALLGWLVTRASLKPLDRLVGFMRRVGASGDYSLRFDPSRRGVVQEDNDGNADLPGRSTRQGGNEIVMLGNELNRMLEVIEEGNSSLRSAHARLETTVTELQQKDTELRHLQKMEAIGLLAGGVAHDFNNILQVVTGFSDLALRRLDPEDPAREFIDEVLKAAQSASMLTRQLLALSSRQLFNPKVINLNGVISDLQKILRKVIGESIELTTELSPDLQNVLADPAQVEQILLNLVVNGRDAIEGAGHIRISTGNCEPGMETTARGHPVFETECVYIAVEDDGCGMDEATRQRVFDPFFTTKEQGKGTGLGLSTVHGIVRQCGGLVQVESEPGQGTTFRVILPAVMVETEEDEEESAGELEEGTETILLVEDDENVRKLVGQMLTLSGYIVLETPGPEQAIALLEQYDQRVDLLVTDVIMPKMNGRELQEEVEHLRPGIPTLFVSGYAAGVIDDVGIVTEGLHFLQKPFTPDALTQKVKQILEEQG